MPNPQAGKNHVAQLSQRRLNKLRMRILELGKFYPPYRGGMETLLKSWAEGFVARGAGVECVVANDRGRTQVSNINGVSVRRLATFGQIWSVSVCPSYLWSTRLRGADVWHAHFPNPLADVAVLLGSAVTPLVLHYHSDVVRQAGLMWLYRPLLQGVLRRATRIVVATPQHIDFSPWLPAWREKCRVIPFGIDRRPLELTPAVAAEVARLRAVAKGRAILLNIGRLVTYKGQRYLIEALRELNAEAWFAGDGPLRADLERVASEAGVAERVRFWGSVDERLLVSLLHACDLFVLPSTTSNEAFGLVQVEAMACGKPVISCALRSGVPFVNQDQVTGLVVPPADSTALASAIQELLCDDARRRSFGEAAKRRAQEEFDQTVMLDRYWALFQEVRTSTPVS